MSDQEIMNRFVSLEQDNLRLKALNAELVGALDRVNDFLSLGLELGFLRETGGPSESVFAIVKSALAKAKEIAAL